MIEFRAVIQRHRPADMPLRQFHAIVRAALVVAGEHWVKHFAKLHFDLGAVQRYKYSARKANYNRKKRNYAKVYDRRRKTVLDRPKPAAPLVLTGWMRDEILRRPPAAYNYRTTSTSNKVLLRIPVRLPHPLNPQNRGEVSDLVQAERETMRKIVIQEIQTRVAKLQQSKTTTVGA